MTNGAETMLTGESGERRGWDRRAEQRRAPRRTYDPLFAATLVNQIAPKENAARGAYPTRRKPPAGIAFDLRA